MHSVSPDDHDFYFGGQLEVPAKGRVRSRHARLLVERLWLRSQRRRPDLPGVRTRHAPQRHDPQWHAWHRYARRGHPEGRRDSAGEHDAQAIEQRTFRHTPAERRSPSTARGARRAIPSSIAAPRRNRSRQTIARSRNRPRRAGGPSSTRRPRPPKSRQKRPTAITRPIRRCAADLPSVRAAATLASLARSVMTLLIKSRPGRSCAVSVLRLSSVLNPPAPESACASSTGRQAAAA